MIEDSQGVNEVEAPGCEGQSQEIASDHRDVGEVDGQLAIAHVRTLEQAIGESIAHQAFNTLLLTIFGTVAVLLAAAAFVVVRLARPVVDRVVRLVERISDPLLRPLWRRA